MAEPISEQTIQNLIDGIDRLVRSTERAMQAAGGTGKGGKVPSAVDEMLGTGFRDSLAKGIEKVFTGASRSAQKQATQQARAARDTSEGVRKANEGVKKSAEGVGGVFGKMAKNSGKLSDALMGTGKAALELTKKLHAGATAASDYVGVTNAAVNVVAGSLLRLGPKGIVMAAALKGVHMLAEASLAQADAQFAAYKELQKFGGATSGGITDVLNLSQALNIGQKELGKLTALIQANASSLAGFRGSVGDGAKDLANISKDLTDAGFRDKFLRLGITIDEQNESTAYYIGLQTRLGRAQNMSVEQLAAGVAEYVQEQDKLTKATGITRKEQQAARDRAMAQETFRAKQMELRASGDPEQIKRADELQEVMTSMEKFGPEIQADLAALVTGMITTEGAGRLQALGNMGGGNIAGIMQDVGAGNISAVEATEKLVETLDKATQVGSTGFGAAQVGAFDKTFVRSFGDLRTAIEQMTGFVARVAKVEVDTKEQAEDKGDAARLAAIEAAALEMRKNTEAFTQIAVPAATTAIRGLAATAELATDALGGIANLAGQTTGGGFSVPSKAKGGVVSGPSSGFPATLHGTEAVVPLPDGKTIPVSIQGSGSSGASIDPGIIERTNTELDTFTGFVTKLSKDFAHILRSQEDDINKGPAFGRDDKRLSLEEKSATALIQIKDLLSEAAGIEAPTWMFGGGGAGQRGGATGGFSGGGAGGGGAGGGGAGGGSPMSSMGGGSGIGAGGGSPMSSMGGGSGVGAGGGARAGSITGPSGESEEAGSLGSGLTANASDLLNFTARSGSAAAFGGLNSKLKDSVLAAAEEYNSITGNKIQINSAFRDPADQQRLWDESVRANRRGRTATNMPIAQPGRSSHEKGLAVDIQNYNDPAAVAAMNRQGLSQKVPSDPVHFSFNGGGIAKGPKSGFPATLHGTEAVVPLPDGKNIPVRIPGMDKITELLGSLPGLLSRNDPGTAASVEQDTAVSIPGMDTLTQLFGSLPSLLDPIMKSVIDTTAPVGRDSAVSIPGMDTITELFGNLPSLLAPMAQSVSRTAAPNLPMMSSPGAALSSIMSSIQPPGGANAPGQDANMTKVLEQLSGVLRDNQGSDQGSAQLLQQLVSLQRDQNASIVKLIQTSMA